MENIINSQTQNTNSGVKTKTVTKSTEITEKRGYFEIVTSHRIVNGVEVDGWDKPAVRPWLVTLIDYDNNTGAYGEFYSEEQAEKNMEAFFEKAMPLYNQKLAKYGPVPSLKAIGTEIDNVEFELDLGQEEDYSYPP